MEKAGKRKREENEVVVVVDGKRAPSAVEDDGGEKVTEEEVEEFFAILRRMQVAVKYFQRDKVDRERRESSTAKGPSRWRPSFEWGDFEGANGVEEREKKEEGVVENAGLDLNVDPEMEGSV